MTMLRKLLITLDVLDERLKENKISPFEYRIQIANVKGLIQFELRKIANGK